MIDPPRVIVSEPTTSALEVRVNFGLLTGREATPAELDDLAGRLVPLLGSVSLVAEHRQETDGRAEAELHQVRIDLAAGDPADEVVAVAERWLENCFETRHAEVAEP
ncbi:MAG TPA: hypothetical protein VGQ15_02345 [Gaiellaceae bacterium]|jgi:hypothetical protein|nr:hypothetical protein [Gaiellaceae bacterium]